MHFIQLVDSLVLLFPQPLTIHHLHPYYHRLKASSSLEEAETILAIPYDTLFYLYNHKGKPSIVDISQPVTTKPIHGTGEGTLLAVFTSIQECYDTYPELFI